MLQGFKKKILIFLFLLTGFSNCLCAQIILRSSRGEIKLERTSEVFENMPLYENDKIETLENSRLKIFIGNKLRVNLGEKSKLTIERYTDKYALLKFYRGLIRVEEIKPFKYQIKTPNSFVINGKKPSNYIISSIPGRSDYICISGHITIYEKRGEYSGNILNGFSSIHKKGTPLYDLWQSSVIVNRENAVLSPGKPRKMEKKEVQIYYSATQVIPTLYDFSKDTIYKIISHDSPLPDFNPKEFEKMFLKKEEKKSASRDPEIFNPESKHGFSFDGI